MNAHSSTNLYDTIINELDRDPNREQKGEKPRTIQKGVCFHVIELGCGHSVPSKS